MTRKLLALAVAGALVAPIAAQASFGGLVGESRAMREIFATLERVAPKELSVEYDDEPGAD